MINRLVKIYKLKAGSVLVLAFLLFCSFTTLEEMPKLFKKKITKEIVSLWGSEYPLTSLNYDEKKTVEIINLGIQNISQVGPQNAPLGIVVWAQARSKFEYFDYAIYYDANKNIKAVRILQYREDYGGEIASKRWLNQFDGLNATSEIAIDHDIQGISGATISYKAITIGVRNITQYLNSN